MKLIFLDIDGVLNKDETDERTPSGFTGVEDIFIERLKKIIDSTEAKIVLSSSWRYEYIRKMKDGIYLEKQLEKQGLLIYDTTLPKNYLKEHEYGGDDWNDEIYRGKQIKVYLDENEDIEQYLILDDETFEFEKYDLKYHFVRTNYLIGLTDKDVKEGIKILNGELSDGSAAEEDFAEHFGKGLIDGYI